MRNVAVEYIDLLVYLAGQYPRYVSTDDIACVVTGEIRTRQRVMKALAEAGYVEVLRTNPLSYRLNPNKFEVFKTLKGK